MPFRFSTLNTICSTPFIYSSFRNNSSTPIHALSEICYTYINLANQPIEPQNPLLVVRTPLPSSQTYLDSRHHRIRSPANFPSLSFHESYSVSAQGLTDKIRRTAALALRGYYNRSRKAGNDSVRVVAIGQFSAKPRWSKTNMSAWLWPYSRQWPLAQALS